jgi:hypothetical protein
VTDDLGRPVGWAIPAVVASLAPWGVTGAHWLPGPHGDPVLWLATRTELQRVVLEAQPWLSAQLHVVLLRYGVAPEDMPQVRVMLESEQDHARLLEG